MVLINNYDLDAVSLYSAGYILKSGLRRKIMLKFIGKLKKYIAEHYTGEEPFVESRRAFYERLLETQRGETRHRHSSTMECLCFEHASKCNSTLR